MFRAFAALLLFVVSSPAQAAESRQPRDVDLVAPDGTALKATFFAAARPGPGVLLLHMCNSNRTAWEPVGRQLSLAGIHALALDYRGFGDSKGDRFESDPQKQQQLMNEKWPGDVDAAFAYLIAQTGVNKTRIGVAGGSCGVNQAVQVARRHHEVKSLVLLAGGTNQQGLEFLQQNAWLPIFASAAADDQFDRDAPRSMQWLTSLSGNPRNTFVGFKDGKHGTEIFGPHPELPHQIVTWYVGTLLKAPAGPNRNVAAKKTSVSEFWAALRNPAGTGTAVQIFHDARQRDANAYLFPEAVMNQTAYERMQAGQMKDAIELFKLNVEAYPTSANAYDSLGDAYLAAGQNEQARAASRKALELLPADRRDDRFKDAIRQSAEEKLEKLKQTAPDK
jgi:dienelactone hydrolase